MFTSSKLIIAVLFLGIALSSARQLRDIKGSSVSGRNLLDSTVQLIWWNPHDKHQIDGKLVLGGPPVPEQPKPKADPDAKHSFKWGHTMPPSPSPAPAYKGGVQTPSGAGALAAVKKADAKMPTESGPEVLKFRTASDAATQAFIAANSTGSLQPAQPTTPSSPQQAAVIRAVEESVKKVFGFMKNVAEGKVKIPEAEVVEVNGATCRADGVIEREGKTFTKYTCKKKVPAAGTP